MAFHLYPQLIPQFCNIGGFGPPRGFTPASPWPWVAHLASGLIPATRRPLQTRFRSGSGYHSLNLATRINSLAHSPKGTRSGIHQSGIALPLFVGIRFQVLFHSGHPGSFHLSLTVLVHYRSPRVFSFRGWTPLIPTGLACPVVLKVTGRSLLTFAYGTLTPSGRPFQCRSASKQISYSFEPLQRPRQALLPQPRNDCSLTRDRFELFPFRSPLLRKFYLLLEVLRCFSSLRAPHHTYVFGAWYPGIPLGGLPHSDISGSKPADGSPKLFAVNHVLLRLLAPRHPPYALCSLIHVIS